MSRRCGSDEGNQVSTILPDHVLRLMRPEDRPKGSAGMLSSEAQIRYQKTQEKRMHEEFEQWLGHRRHELYWDHSRMDRATRNRVGHPDFVLQRQGRVLNIEFKAEGGKLSEKQSEVHAWLTAIGSVVNVCFSSGDAIRITKETFSL